MKRILVYGMTDNRGGIERYLVNLAYRLKDKIAFDYITDFPDIAHREELEEQGSKIFFIPAKSKGVFAHLKAFYKVLKEHKEYSLVYFNILDAGAAVTQVVPFILGRKIVTHSHNGDTDKKALHKFCKPFLKLFTKSRVACSLLAAKYMFDSQKNVLIVPNAIDTARFAFDNEKREQKRKELGIEDKKVICHIGRLSNQKNPLRLLQIFKTVIEKDSNFVLLSVGAGEMQDEVRAYSKVIGVDKNVLFLGMRTDIEELLFASDIFFLPSLYEGLPIVALEAQASGLPLILSDRITKEIDICGTAEFISLDESNDVFAQSILSAAGNRYNCTEKLVAAGYDINQTKENDEKILKILGE